MTNFLELFEPIQKGDFGLTDEAIYKSIQGSKPFIPVWGGNKEHSIPERMISINGKTKFGSKITVFEGEGIIISLDGSSGSMTFKEKQEFALNHHAGFFKVRSDAKNKIIPKFFAYFYNTQLSNESISEGSKTLTLDQIYNMDFNIPDFSIQNKVMIQLKSLLEKSENIAKVLEKINLIGNKSFSHDYKKYQAKDVPISEVIDYMSGNSGLTELFIYQKSQQKGKKYVVLSSSTEEDTKMGEIPKCDLNGKPLKVFEDKEGLLVVRNGKAGTTLYLPRGNYTINDHAYILYVKEKCSYQINLKWLSIQYKQDFLHYASSSDNGTWNMTGFFENLKFDIPEYREQIAVVQAYEQLEKYGKGLKEIEIKSREIFSKTVV